VCLVPLLDRVIGRMKKTHKAEMAHGGRPVGVQKSAADRKQRHKDMIDALFKEHTAKPSVDATQKDTTLETGVEKKRHKQRAQSKARPC
jgi:hypothetical protein